MSVAKGASRKPSADVRCPIQSGYITERRKILAPTISYVLVHWGATGDSVFEGIPLSRQVFKNIESVGSFRLKFLGHSEIVPLSTGTDGLLHKAQSTNKITR